jgi:hypothetical protein
VVGEAVSPVLKRPIVIARHKTSVSVEDEFWDSLKEIAGDRGTTVAALVGVANMPISRQPFDFLCLASIAIKSPAGAGIERGDLQN